MTRNVSEPIDPLSDPLLTGRHVGLRSGARVSFGPAAAGDFWSEEFHSFAGFTSDHVPNAVKIVVNFGIQKP